MNINFRAILYINGIATCFLSCILTIPVVYDILTNNSNCIWIFVPSIIATVFLGGLLVLSCRSNEKISFSRRDIFLLVLTIWLCSSFVSAFPFYVYSGQKLKFISAMFEAVSGITTTGITVYTNVELLPEGLNLWRFILHFIGGVGIIAIGVTIFPKIRNESVHLFQTENSDKTQKLFPRMTKMIQLFIGTYIIFIAIFSCLLKLFGMNTFDSICHAISAISTGGFSTKNAGVEFYETSSIKLILSIGMFFGGITFLEIIKCIKNGIKLSTLSKQTTGYLKLVVIAICVPIIAEIIFNGEHITYGNIVSHIYTTISAITTTGLGFDGHFLQSNIILLIMAIVGGCSGSTTGGIKIFRIQILIAVVQNSLKKVLKPFFVSIPKYQGKRIDETQTNAIILFLSSLIILFLISCILLEISLDKTISEVVYITFSCLFNVGCSMDISNFPTISKIILMIDMIAGRLEVIPMFVIMCKFFWKN